VADRPNAAWTGTVGRALSGVAVAVAVAVPAMLFARGGFGGGSVSVSPEQAPVPAVAVGAEVRAAARALPTRFESIPVLNYHDISERDSPYALPGEIFAAHMAALDEAGVTTVTLEEVEAVLAGDVDGLPDRPVLLTFDDGIATVWERADPILARHGFNAVAFLITSSVAETARSYYLSRQALQAMAESGRWAFGAHTHDQHHLVETPAGARPALLNRAVVDGALETVPQWEQRVAPDLDTNIVQIGEIVGSAPIAFAHPFSATDNPTNDPLIPPVLAGLVSDRFPLAFTASQGKEATAIVEGSDSRALPRLSVTSDVSATDLIRRLGEMVPEPLPVEVATASWQPGPPSCEPGDRSVLVHATGYVRCRTEGHGALDAPIELSSRVTGTSPAVTAIVGLEGSEHEVELAVGASRAELRLRQAGGSWEVLDEVVLSRASEGREVSIAVDDGEVTATVDDAEISGLAPDDMFVAVVLAVAADDGSVRFGDLTAEPLSGP
jgi:poly-beta-1,6-N-acetyl-D-glucosamine N-deacetylase